MLHSICYVGTHGLPNMFTISHWACTSCASGVHIRMETTLQLKSMEISKDQNNMEIRE